MLPLDFECPDCELEMEPSDGDPWEHEESVTFECPDCGYMIEFYEEDGETYANEIY